MKRERVCAHCGKPTRGKDWVEAAGIRICIDCVHKRYEKIKCLCDPELGIPNRFCPVHGAVKKMEDDHGGS